MTVPEVLVRFAIRVLESRRVFAALLVVAAAAFLGPIVCRAGRDAIFVDVRGRPFSEPEMMTCPRCGLSGTWIETRTYFCHSCQTRMVKAGH